MMDRGTCIRKIVSIAALTVGGLGCAGGVRAFEPGNIRYEFPCKVTIENRPEFSAEAFDDSRWPELSTFLSRRYQAEHLIPPGGLVWNRVHLKIAANLRGRDLVIRIEDGQVLDAVYLNGIPLLSCWQSAAIQPPMRRVVFAVPADLVRFDGENVLALRYYNFPMPREDTLGRVEVGEVDADDCVQVGWKGSYPYFGLQTRSDALDFEVSSGLPREQTVTVHWRVEDYFGAELKHGRSEVNLKPAGQPAATANVSIGVAGDDRAYKVVVRPEVQGRKGPETWGYIGKWATVNTDHRMTRQLVGGWEFAAAPGVKELNPAAPTAADWKPVTMPHELWNHKNEMKTHRSWYRCKLAVPAEMAGKKIALSFYEVSCQVEVFVDGVPAGRKTEWEVPGEFDLTDKVTPGRTHELLLGVTDYIAALDPADRDKAVDGDNTFGTRALLGPVHPWMLHSGISCVPELKAYPRQARLERVRVESLVNSPGRVNRLKVTAQVANGMPGSRNLTVRAEVLLRGKPVKTLPVREVEVPGNSVKGVVMEADFREGECWTLDSPTLYQLKARLVDRGRVVDETDTRFGFRQFDTAGRFITMNGLPLRAMGADFWAPDFSPRRTELLDMCRALPTRDVSYTHAVGAGMFNVLDEAGGLAFADNLDAMANTGNYYAYEDPRLYRNIISKFRCLIDALDGHPSIMIWDWGNEFPYYVGKCIDDEGVRLACRAVEDIQRLDPTRFSVASALGSGRGCSTMRLLPTHSGTPGPGEIPNAMWYYGPAEETPEYLRRLFTWDLKNIFYLSESDRARPRFWPGGRPIYHSELGHWGYVGDIETGDQLYCPQPRRRKYARSWFWCGPGAWYANETARGDFYRLVQTWLRGCYGATHVAQGAGEEKLARVAVFPQYWEDKCWSGEVRELPIFVVNNYFRAEDVYLEWGLYGESGRRLAGGRKSWTMDPCSMREDALPLTFPEVKDAGYCRLIYAVTSKTRGNEYRGQERFTVFPRGSAGPAATGLRLGLYDPSGTTAAVLRKAGLEFDAIPSIGAADLGRYRLLMLGENCVDDTVVQVRDAVLAAVGNGLTCVVLLQESAKSVFPVMIKENQTYRANAHLITPRHDLVKGLLAGDFRWWRNPFHDHLVAINPLSFPASANVRNIVDGCLVEIPWGRGRYVIYQMPLIRDLGTEPVVDRLLENLFLSAKAPASSSRQLAVLVGDRDFVTEWAAKVGLQTTSFPVRDPQKAVLLTRGSSLAGADPVLIRDFLNAGGVLWVNGIGSDAAHWLRTRLNVDVELKPNPRLFAVLKRRAPVLNGFSNAELAWYSGLAGTKAEQTGRTGDDLGQEEILGTGAESCPLMEPSYLVERSVGKGRLVLDNVRWPYVTLAKAQYYFVQMAYNLGLTDMVEPVKAKKRNMDYSVLYDFTPLDIGPVVNLGFADEKAGDRKGGWTDQGPENDMSHLPVGTDLRCLGVPVRIVDPALHEGKGCIGLRGGTGGDLPREVAGIKVGFKADALFFFHTAAWGPRDDCLRYRIWYEDRKTWIPGKPDPRVDVIVRAGAGIGDWWHAGALAKEEDTLSDGELAWSGRNKQAVVGFYVQVWKNPHPEKVIESVDVTSIGKTGQYFVIGITAGVEKR